MTTITSFFLWLENYCRIFCKSLPLDFFACSFFIANRFFFQVKEKMKFPFSPDVHYVISKKNCVFEIILVQNVESNINPWFYFFSSRIVIDMRDERKNAHSFADRKKKQKRIHLTLLFLSILYIDSDMMSSNSCVVIKIISYLFFSLNLFFSRNGLGKKLKCGPNRFALVFCYLFF